VIKKLTHCHILLENFMQNSSNNTFLLQNTVSSISDFAYKQCNNFTDVHHQNYSTFMAYSTSSKTIKPGLQTSKVT